MAVPLVGAGIMTAGRAGLSYWAKKKLQREAAARLALETSRTSAVPGLTSGAANWVSAGPKNRFANTMAKYTAAGAGGVAVGNSIEAMTQQPNGGDLHPRVEAMDRLRNGGGMTGLEKNSRGYYPDQKGDNPLFNPDTLGSYPDFEASEWELNIMKKLRQIDGMNLTPEAKDLLKENYIGSQTGAAMTEEETQELLRGRTGAASTRGELDMFMGMPKGR